MADDQRPLVRVIRFHHTFERVPVKGDELRDDVDAKGYKIDAKGKRVMESIEVDWVTYAPSHAPLTAATTERVRHLRPTEEMIHGEQSEKSKFMRARWDAIEPAYDAWKSGHEIPTHGMPLAHWPGVSAPAAEELRRYGIRTVEEVRDLTDGQLDKIRLPNMRDLRKAARAFIDNVDTANMASREAERDSEIEALKAALAEQQEQFAAAMALLEEKTSGKGEIDDLRAQLDAKGIKYHHKAGIDTLRALLTEDAA
ncbi:hypothetical protein [Rhizobium sp. BK661]|uniref:hypothetical protein n=1 Tax=Rhizobium sp. BK661 TaxID=2586991 RepID=UPI00216A6BA1|nr:hypothetical protein [Rhizobium sp. BK661]MCS3741989.1 hypothetical protein [Rhizobium sp. BK661]